MTNTSAHVAALEARIADLEAQLIKAQIVIDLRSWHRCEPDSDGVWTSPGVCEVVVVDPGNGLVASLGIQRAGFGFHCVGPGEPFWRWHVGPDLAGSEKESDHA